MPHNCHARYCTTVIPPKLFMCLKHWRMVPKRLQALIWYYYRPGQETDKQPSEAYVLVAELAIIAVMKKEAK